jgi:outer membrane murein-binding lipoprotein Lpp
MATKQTATAFADRRILALRASLGAFADGVAKPAMKSPLLVDAACSWVEMAYESEWNGHPAGPFAFNRAVFADIKRLYDAGEQPVPVLWGHPRHDLGVPIDAAGWIQALEVRDGADGVELWGYVEWTKDAADRIALGAQRFCSVVVDFAPIDRVTGESAGLAELYELGLTPSPFLPGMTPITLSRVGAPSRKSTRSLAMDPTKVLMAIATALGLKKDATPEKMKKAFDALVALAGAMAEESMPVAEIASEGVAEMMMDEKKVKGLSRIAASVRKLADELLVDEMVEGVPDVSDLAEEATEAAGTMVLGKLVEATGMDEAGVVAAITEKLDQIAAMLVAGPVSGMSADAGAQMMRQTTELSAHKARAVELAATVQTLQAQVAELSRERVQRQALERTARISASFSRLLDEGRVTEAQRTAFVSASEQNETLALDIYSALPATAQPPVGALVTGPKAARENNVAKLSSSDPLVNIFRADAKAAGLRGKAADDHVAVMLSKHAARNSGA